MKPARYQQQRSVYCDSCEGNSDSSHNMKATCMQQYADSLLPLIQTPVKATKARSTGWCDLQQFPKVKHEGLMHRLQATQHLACAPLTLAAAMLVPLMVPSACQSKVARV
jgi:hypothetical protein